MRKIINSFVFLLKIIDIYTYVRVLLFLLYTIVTDFFCNVTGPGKPFVFIIGFSID